MRAACDTCLNCFILGFCPLLPNSCWLCSSLPQRISSENMAQKCPWCNKTVYFAERQMYNGKEYHQMCVWALTKEEEKKRGQPLFSYGVVDCFFDHITAIRSTGLCWIHTLLFVECCSWWRNLDQAVFRSSGIVTNCFSPSVSEAMFSNPHEAHTTGGQEAALKAPRGRLHLYSVHVRAMMHVSGYQYLI